jgi:glyoxylase-like metal-dependent hydrolase (beta-lactamase superfamily II)
MANIHLLDLQFQGHSHTIAAFAVNTRAGLVLVETGPHSTLPALQHALRQAGFDENDVKHVLLTHIHLDHAGAAWYFASRGASVYVHPAGYDHLLDPSRLLASASRIYGDDMDRLWGQLRPVQASQLHVCDDREQLHIGEAVFTAHHTPGHAIHHIAWQLGQDVFTGDVAGIRIEGGPVVPPCPPPDIHIGHWMESIRRIEQLQPQRLWLTHFGPVHSVASHLQQLRTILIDWALWIKPHAEQGKSPEEIVPAFQAYVRQQLLDAGVDETQIERYESANPSWMSVAGLMRYWRKYGAEEKSTT